VIKLGHVDRLPVGEVVTLDTIRTESPFVRILVAGGAGLRNAQKRPRQILHLDRRARCGGDVVGGVATSAGHSGMLAFENVTGELMIERLAVPLDERKILTVVFGMAAGALIA